MKIILSLAVFLSMFAVTGVAADGNPEHGKQLYEIYCTQCHGLKADGKGINVADMAVQPRDHTDKVEMSARTDEELIKAIKHGGKSVNKSVLMPSWEGNLSDGDIEDLVAYLRTICCQP